MKPTPRAGWLSGRTTLITFVSIVVVGIAGVLAVGANVGILNAAGASKVGSLSAAGDLTPTSKQVVDVYLKAPATIAPSRSPSTAATTPVATADPSAAAPGAKARAQEFAVDVAGTVRVSTTAGGIRFDGATPAAGWKWSLAQSKPAELNVKFTNGARTLEFLAVAKADGTVGASVNEPIMNAAPASPSVRSTASVKRTAAANAVHDGGQHGYEGGEDDD